MNDGMNRIIKIIRDCLIGILTIILLLNLWMITQKIIFKKPLPTVFGYSQATVLSGSMEPTFSVGDMLIYKVEDKYKKDDIVIFIQEDHFVTHRIIKEEDGQFITQGDANNVQDKGQLTNNDIYGKLVLVLPGLGNVIQFFRTPLGVLCIILLGLVIWEYPRLKEKYLRKGNK